MLQWMKFNYMTYDRRSCFTQNRVNFHKNCLKFSKNYSVFLHVFTGIRVVRLMQLLSFKVIILYFFLILNVGENVERALTAVQRERVVVHLDKEIFLFVASKFVTFFFNWFRCLFFFFFFLSHSLVLKSCEKLKY